MQGLADRFGDRVADAAAVRRAARVTVASLAGFYPGLWLLNQPVFATYSLFTVIALGALSTVSAPPARRTRIYLTSAAIGVVLAVLGTWTSITLASAVTGMFVVALAIGLAGVGGPRVVGVSGGLQLFYILACFPPYLPDTLGARVAGIAVGAVLLVAADRLMWPEPGPVGYDARLAQTLGDVAQYAARLHPGTPADELRRAGARAGAAVDAQRLSAIPVAERPLSAGRRDRSRRHSAESLRFVYRQLMRVEQLVGSAVEPPAAQMSAALADTLRACELAIRRDGPAPGPAMLRAALAELDAVRRVPTVDRMTMRVTGRLSLAAGAAAAVVEHCRVAVGAPVTMAAELRDRDPSLWYVDRPVVVLYARRLLLELTTRSVTLQNALRTALVLAAARLVAGVFDLSHGFWVLLAALTLMRTSAVDTRSTLRPAFLGTFAGALAGGLIILLVGPDRWVYAVITPFAMLVAFTLGPLLGLAWGQGGFAVVVSVLFMQLAPGSWRLAGTRLLDVVVGGAVGAVVGALTWPRGGGGELRRSVTRVADQVPSLLRIAVAAVAGDGTRSSDADRDAAAAAAARAERQASHAWYYFETCYIQYRAERPDDTLDEAALRHAVDAGRFAVRGAAFLRLRFPSPPLEPVAQAAALQGLADAAAAQVQSYAALLAGGPATAPEPPDPASFPSPGGPNGPRVADLEAYLFALALPMAPDAPAATDSPDGPAPGSAPVAPGSAPAAPGSITAPA